MTANVLILSAAGMLVSVYLMVGQKALHDHPSLWPAVPPLGRRGHHDGDFRIAP